jgi:hypothetical protein
MSVNRKRIHYADTNAQSGGVARASQKAKGRMQRRKLETGNSKFGI